MWAARVAVELLRRGAKGSLKELTAIALKLWVTNGDQCPEVVAMQHEYLSGKEPRGRSDIEQRG